MSTAAKEIRDADGFAIVVRRAPVTYGSAEYSTDGRGKQKPKKGKNKPKQDRRDRDIKRLTRLVEEQSETIENMRRHMERESDTTIYSGKVARAQKRPRRREEPRRSGLEVDIDTGKDHDPTGIFGALNIGGFRIGIDPGRGIYVGVRNKRK